MANKLKREVIGSFLKSKDDNKPPYLKFRTSVTLKEGDIVQIKPEKEMFGACMVTVTEVKTWGIQGYVQSAGVEGQQYVRVKTEDFEPTGGRAVWVAN